MVALPHSRVRCLPGAWLLVGVLIAVVALGFGLLMTNPRHSGSASTSSTIDPRLIIYPTQTHMRGFLSNGVFLTGSLSPTMPGKNTVQLVLSPVMSGASRPAAITLTAAMLGMHMIPTRAVLTRTVRGYAGTITLPMFGAYRMRVEMQTPAGMQRGIIIIKLPLPRW